MISLAPSPLVLVAALLLSSLAFAGQLHVERFGLDDVARGGDAVALGVIEATGLLTEKEKKTSRDTTLELRVEQVWGASDVFEKGKVAKLRLYGGVIWDNPNKSPIERRLDGAAGAMKGDRVIAVPHHGATVEVLPATEENLIAVRVLFDEAERAKWLASETPVLQKALGRADLASLALAELDRRGALGPAQLLVAEHQFLFDHVRQMEPARKRRFLDEATPLARNDAAIRDRVFQLAAYDPKPETVGALVPLIAMYDPAKKEDRRRFDDVHFALAVTSKSEPGSTLDLSPFASFLIAYERTRPDHKRGDDDFERITRWLSPAAKAEVAIGFLRTAHDTTFSGKEIDEWILFEASRLTAEAPSASIVPALAAVNPDVPRVRSSKERAMTALLEAGTAIVKALPAERERTRAILEPLLAKPVPVEKDALAAWRAAAGAP